MNRKKQMLKNKGKGSSKKQKDQLSVILAGVVMYSVVLIAVLIGTYVGVEYVIKRNMNISNAGNSVKMSTVNTLEKSDNKKALENEKAKEKDSKEDYKETDAKNEIKGKHILENGYVNYDKIVFKPRKRNATYKWDDTVFSKLENVKDSSRALINNYEFTRKKAKCIDEKDIVFEIYTNPDSGLCEKITTLEYCGDEIETTDYYYDNGHINYIAQYRDVINVPIDISSGSVQSRFYFKNDTMVKYIYCEADKATEYNVSAIKNYSIGTVEQYDYLESSMLNKAYITYNVIKELPEVETIKGYVFDEFNSGIADACVKIVNEKSGKQVSEAKTNGDGLYLLEIPVEKDTSYTIEIRKSSLKECKIYNVKAYPGSLTYNVSPVYLGYEENGAEYNFTFAALDGKNKMSTLEGANIYIRKGFDKRDGEIVAEAVLDENGAATVSLLADNYTVETQKEGYITSYSNISVKGDNLIGIGYSIQELEEQEGVVILAWDNNAVQIGSEALLDLDLRVFSSNSRLVVKSDAPREAGFPSEIIDIKNMGSDTYAYYVSDYSDCAAGDTMSYSMSASGAKLYVFMKDKMEALYSVPVASCGVIWKPFEIRNGRLININDYHYVCDEDSRFTRK